MPYNDGKNYELFVNKFLKGKIVSDFKDSWDIERNCNLYEVKGTKLHEKNRNTLGRYKINLTNHNNLVDSGRLEQKKSKYVFVLQVEKRLLFKTMSAEAVTHYIKEFGKKHTTK